MNPALAYAHWFENLPSLVFLAFFAGLFHMIAPDHWVPSSILNWRAGWSASRRWETLSLASLIHVALGGLLYLALGPVLLMTAEADFFFYSTIFICTVMVVRSLRYGRVEEVLLAQSESRWPLWVLVSMLGPADVLVPVLLRSDQLGVRLLDSAVAFLAGSFLGGLILTEVSANFWGRAYRIPRSIAWLQSRASALPGVLGLAAVLAFLQLR